MEAYHELIRIDDISNRSNGSNLACLKTNSIHPQNHCTAPLPNHSSALAHEIDRKTGSNFFYKYSTGLGYNLTANPFDH
jgi:hypothetical protein